MAAFDDYTMTIHEDDQDFDIYDHLLHDLHLHHPHNLSRLSICNNRIDHKSLYNNDDGEDEDDGGHDMGMGMFMSHLSIECSDGDADEELSDDDKEHKEVVSGDSSVDQSDKELSCQISLPGTPCGGGSSTTGSIALQEEYSGSDNEISSQSAVMRNRVRKNSVRRSRMTRERWLERAWEKKKYKAGGMMSMDEMEHSNSPFISCSSTTPTLTPTTPTAGESSDHHRQCLLITRPNGGRRSLCMDLEEVRACRDLGFELEHERMLEIPTSTTRISMSPSAIDSSSGGNSPIANWKISSPGDDPRDIKARLKVWAQAVALASASQLC